MSIVSDKTIAKIYFGEENIVKVYVGESLVFGGSGSDSELDSDGYVIVKYPASQKAKPIEV